MIVYNKRRQWPVDSLSEYWGCNVPFAKLIQFKSHHSSVPYGIPISSRCYIVHYHFLPNTVYRAVYGRSHVTYEHVTVERFQAQIAIKLEHRASALKLDVLVEKTKQKNLYLGCCENTRKTCESRTLFLVFSQHQEW